MKPSTVTVVKSRHEELFEEPPLCAPPPTRVLLLLLLRFKPVHPLTAPKARAMRWSWLSRRTTLPCPCSARWLAEVWPPNGKSRRSLQETDAVGVARRSWLRRLRSRSVISGNRPSFASDGHFRSGHEVRGHGGDSEICPGPQLNALALHSNPTRETPNPN